VTDTRRIALVVEYDGGRYAGSQRQADAPTIQAALESAVQELTGEPSRVALAGRTDAGVHALGQVAAFDTTSRLTEHVLLRGLNAKLPADIAVHRVVCAPPDFDPRRHASSRIYAYEIYNSQTRAPLQAHAWHVSQQLDTSRMSRAAAQLTGRHDFAAFSRSEPATTVRCLRRCDVARHGATLTVEMEANAFLRQQVRRTVGALVDVGTGRLSEQALRDLLEQARPNSVGPVAPAHGLTLVSVKYDGLDLAGEMR
jgi:tRNA pseudouridine38-40 synthase